MEAKLEPGRELDALAHEKRGHSWFECWNYEEIYSDELEEVVGYNPLEVLDDVPHYSEDDNAAGEILEHVRTTMPKMCIDISLERYEGGISKWACLFHNPNDTPLTWGSAEQEIRAHAICLAFLALKKE